jgi:hypothetical protein
LLGLLVLGVYPNHYGKVILAINTRGCSILPHWLNLRAIARYEMPQASAIAAVGTPIIFRYWALSVSFSFAMAYGLEGGHLALYFLAKAESSRSSPLIAGGTPGEMDLKRGADFSGTEVVKDFGGGGGISRNCF